MVDTLGIELETLTPAAFAPFGQVIGPSDEEPSFLVSWVRGSRLAYDADEPTALLFMEYRHIPFECDTVERHFGVTQAFIPLAGTPSIMLVAAPTGGTALPAPADFRAFYVPGSVGIMLWKATWHALTRFPVPASGGSFVLLTGRETQTELERASRDGSKPTRTETLSLIERYGTKLKIIDPRGLIESLQQAVPSSANSP